MDSLRYVSEVRAPPIRWKRKYNVKQVPSAGDSTGRVHTFSVNKDSGSMEMINGNVEPMVQTHSALNNLCGWISFKCLASFRKSYRYRTLMKDADPETNVVEIFHASLDRI